VVGYAPGFYDMFHVAHLNILRHAKSQCDYLIAGVVSDEMCELAKGRPPIVAEPERLEIVLHISYVDAARSCRTKLETLPIRAVRVSTRETTGEEPPRAASRNDGAEVGVEVINFPHTSSSMLRRVLVRGVAAPGSTCRLRVRMNQRLIMQHGPLRHSTARSHSIG